MVTDSAIAAPPSQDTTKENASGCQMNPVFGCGRSKVPGSNRPTWRITRLNAAASTIPTANPASSVASARPASRHRRIGSATARALSGA